MLLKEQKQRKCRSEKDFILPSSPILDRLFCKAQRTLERLSIRKFNPFKGFFWRRWYYEFCLCCFSNHCPLIRRLRAEGPRFRGLLFNNWLAFYYEGGSFGVFCHGDSFWPLAVILIWDFLPVPGELLMMLLSVLQECASPGNCLTQSLDKPGIILTGWMFLSHMADVKLRIIPITACCLQVVVSRWRVPDIVMSGCLPR